MLRDYLGGSPKDFALAIEDYLDCRKRKKQIPAMSAVDIQKSRYEFITNIQSEEEELQRQTSIIKNDSSGLIKIVEQYRLKAIEEVIKTRKINYNANCNRKPV